MPRLSEKSQTKAFVTAAPAGLTRRLGAFVYDVLLIVALWMFTILGGVLLNEGETVAGTVLQLILATEALGFYLYFWARQGQTLGMRAWRLKLVTGEGGQPNLSALFKRALLAPISFLCFGLGYLWYFVGARQQTWHDRGSDTYVVLLPKAR